MSPVSRLSWHTALWAAWALVTAGWVAALVLGAALTALSSGASCELVPGSSVYGQASWSAVHLGRVCAYTLQQPAVTLVDAPHLRWLVTGLLLLWGVSLLRWRRGARRTPAALAV